MKALRLAILSIIILALVAVFIFGPSRNEKLVSQILEQSLTTEELTPEIADALTFITQNTRFKNRWQVNKEPRKRFLNVYVLDGNQKNQEISVSRGFNQLFGNCAYLGERDFVVCDSEFLKLFLPRHGFLFVPDDSEIQNKRKFFLLWVLGHELGHIIKEHSASHHEAGAFENSVSPSGIDHAKEVEADSLLVELLLADDETATDFIDMMRTLFSYEIWRKSPYPSGPAPNDRLRYFSSNSHPDFLVRMVILLQQFPEETLGAGLKSYVKEIEFTVEEITPKPPDQRVLDARGIAISALPGWHRAPSIAWGHGAFLAVWWNTDALTSENDIYGARIGPGGKILDGDVFQITNVENFQIYPAVSAGGRDFLVTWLDQRTDEIFGARISASGEVLDPAGFPIITATDELWEFWSPSISWNGKFYLVTASGAYIYGTLVDNEGKIATPGGFPISTWSDSQNSPSIASGNGDFFVVWVDGTQGKEGIYGALVDGTGTIEKGDILISLEPDANNPKVVWGNGRYFTVWDCKMESVDWICGTLVDALGMVIKGSKIQVTRGKAPSVARSGEDFLVVYEYENDIYGTRITGDGKVLDPGGFRISTSANQQGSPVVAQGENLAFVVWEDSRNGLLNTHGARINPTPR